MGFRVIESRSMVSKRNPIFDICKFFAMLLVVYWHCMSYRDGFKLSETPSYSANFIIAVNMPLFFMISGYFSRNLHESGDWSRLLRRLVSYFWPLAFFSTVYAGLETAFLDMYCIAGFPLLAIKRFLFCGWFFYALAICDVATYLIYRCGPGRKRQILIAAAFFLLFCVLSNHIWHVSNVVAMIPFYWFGLVIFPRLIDRELALMCVGGAGFFAMVYVTFFAGNIATNGLSFYWDQFDICSLRVNMILNMVLRYIVGILGSVFIVASVHLLCLSAKCITKISFLGTETLGIFFVHDELVAVVNRELEVIIGDCLSMLVLASCVYVFSYLVVWGSKRLRCIRYIVWGN